MAFFLLCVSILVIFLQPEVIFPALATVDFLRISVLGALMFYLFEGKKQKSASFFSTKTNIFFLLFAFCQIISSCKIWIHGGIETFNLWLRIGITYYLVVKSITSEKRIKWLVFFVLLGVFYMSISSINSYFHDTSLIKPAAHAYGWYENSNDLALILLCCIPLALIMVNVNRNFFIKYLFVFLTAVFGFNMLFTFSRGALMGLLVVGSLGVISSSKMSRILRFFAIIVLVVAGITVGISNIKNRPDLVDGRLTGDESSENRIVQWRAGLSMIKHNPLLGIGRGEFPSVADQYGGIRGLAPHNTLIQVFSETGIPGGIFFFLFAVMPLYDAWKLSMRMRKSESQAVKSLSIYLKFLSIALIGFWMMAFFGNRYNEYILYIVIALIVGFKQNILGVPPNMAFE